MSHGCTRCLRSGLLGSPPAGTRTPGTVQPALGLGSRGLGEDESRSFVRALDAGLVRVLPDGEFTLPGAAHNLNRPHLIGEDGKGGMTLHTEYLIHIGAYAELVLDHDWPAARLALDMGPWDLHGLRSDGSVSLLMEAKARFDGRDGVARLRDDLHGLARDPSRPVTSTTRKKYEALLEVCQESPVRVWLVADACWMLYLGRRVGAAVELTAIDSIPEPESSLDDEPSFVTLRAPSRHRHSRGRTILHSEAHPRWEQ
jgi:hypothetical protein